MRLLALLSFLLCITPAFSMEKLYIESSQNEVKDLSNYVEVFLDSTNKIELEQLLHTDKFTTNQQNIINVGFNEAALWLRFSLENLSLEEKRDFILEIGNSNLDVIEVFEMENGELVNHLLLGDQIKFSERPLAFRTNLYSFDIGAKSGVELYLKIQTNGALQVPLTLATPTKFFINHITTETAFGIYIGIMLVMVLYNILIFLSLKDLNYLYYAFPILANTIFFLSLSGHHFQYLLPNNPAAANNVTVVSIALWILTSSFYAKSSLQSKKYSRIADFALIVTMLIGLIGVALPFITDYAFAVRFNSKMTLVNSLTMFLAGLLIWYKGNKSARFFILAWTAYLMGTFIFALMKFNYIEQNAFTKNVLAYGGVIEVLFLSLALSDKYKLYKREKERAQRELLAQQLETNAQLEEKVKERTSELEDALSEINDKNTELEQQNEEIAAQRDMVEKQKIVLQESNVKIQSSINYAERIQTAMLPSVLDIKSHFPNSFVFFKPKDIVSGDFYWSAQVGSKKVIAAVDCTGHGVPGAFMSLVGNNLLKDIIVKSKIISPEVILQALHIQISKNLYEGDNKLRDGMDMSLVVFDEATNEVAFAGARNPLLIHQNGELKVIKGDRNSIGSTKPAVSFTKHTIKVDQPTLLYLYSDGFQDQFGGHLNKKYGSKQFRNYLDSIAIHDLSLQEQLIQNEFEKWVGNDQNHQKQTDDILVVGVKLAPH